MQICLFSTVGNVRAACDLLFSCKRFKTKQQHFISEYIVSVNGGLQFKRVEVNLLFEFHVAIIVTRWRRAVIHTRIAHRLRVSNQLHDANHKCLGFRVVYFENSAMKGGMLWCCEQLLFLRLSYRIVSHRIVSECIVLCCILST